MKRRQVKKQTAEDIRKTVTDTILAALREGTNPWQRPWANTGGSGMPHNCATGHVYRGINVAYLWAEQSLKGYPTAQWISFNECKKRGGHVTKGEKATGIIFTKPLRLEDKDGDKEKDRTIFMMKTYPVFNIAQTEGVKLPKKEQPIEDEELPDEKEIAKNAIAFVKAAGAKLKFNSGRAFYSPLEDRIEMPRVNTFKKAEGFACTAYHELVHWTGHKSRMERVGIVNFDRFGTEQYAFEELVAEMGSAMLCNYLGVGSEIPNHASYIASWIKCLEKDPKAIFRASMLSTGAVEFLVPELMEQAFEEAA